MMGGLLKSQWQTLSLTVLALSYLSLYLWRRKSSSILSDGEANTKIRQLEASLMASLQKCAAERQGRIRAQKSLREALSRSNCDKVESSSYPMAPIAVVRSCFSTRNGTPRQPLLVPLAKASLIFNPARVPQAALEGLEGYSHCWILYVFHLNTDLEKLWKHPSQSKFKAKVRVPRLKGERIGVFATRSPHRPCPIGLTVAKVEAVHGHAVLLSGVDLVDGTPVLDIKPYLPYCDSIQGATVPDWVKVDNVLAIASVNFSEGFSSSLADCWSLMVLSWDIRSVAQRNHPHQTRLKKTEAGKSEDDDVENTVNEAASIEGDANGGDVISSLSSNIVYRLILEGLDVSYRIDSDANVVVENVSMASHTRSCSETSS